MEIPLVSHNNRCKIIFIGESGVGKTSIISQFRHNTIDNSYRATIGVDFHIKSINICGKNVKLQIWDTSGHSTFRAILGSYYKTADVVCFCYDITNSDSINDAKTWINSIKQHAPDNIIIYAVGNKLDQQYRRSVNNIEFIKYCDINNIINIEVSAQDTTTINNLFYDIVFTYLQHVTSIETYDEHKNNYCDCCNIS
jgi:Ras-related protein Rab-1A